MFFIIGKINDVYFLDKYGKVIFTKKELKEMVKNSIIIEPNPIKDLSIIYNCALEICKNENIEYIDNFENIQEIIDLSQIKIEKIIDNNTHKEEDVDYFYQYICKKTYDNIKLYVRDMELSNEIITLYQNNIGKTIKEKSFVDCTKKIGGLVKNTRTYIISNSIEDFSLFEQDTNYGLCVANENSYFKIIDVQTVENKNYIILLQLDKDTRHFLENISTNIDIEIKNIGKEQFQKDIKSKHLEELDDNWYKRLFFPIGINKNGEIIQNHE